ncbi:MAG: Hsp33 family molecular chaperone HslO [Lachnospiraceae bacterium]|nr:Hsp33 family molecular chaperone HslO [Lachnospiraceae bacterium]MBR3638538.1 Hsp33 family molecular chaperone HslO [Lachnospiraceae bacterium]
MSDRIVRATAANAQIRIFAADTKDTVETARVKHQTTPVATAALGRLLTAGAMMGTMLKGADDLLTLKITGDGPLGGIVVTADANADVKGYVGNPNADLPLNAKGKLDVSGAVGKGRLDIIRDMGLKEPYVGQTPLISGEIAEDLTFYFANSEQVPSSVGLGVLVDRDYTVKRAGGFIVQLLPNASDEVIDRLEENLSKIKSVTAFFESGLGAEDLIRVICEGMDPEITDTIPVRFYCNCSRERVEKALISIGHKELDDMIADGKEVNLNCGFCNTDYTFSVEDLKRIREK